MKECFLLTYFRYQLGIKTHTQNVDYVHVGTGQNRQHDGLETGVLVGGACGHENSVGGTISIKYSVARRLFSTRRDSHTYIVGILYRETCQVHYRAEPMRTLGILSRAGRNDTPSCG